MKSFKINFGGIKREYPIVRLSETVRGVYFFLPGDVPLTEYCAEQILEKSSGFGFDIVVVPEVGGIPLAHSLARRTEKEYLVIRKRSRLYMKKPIIEDIRSITTSGIQQLVLDSRDVPKIKDKRVLVLDDVISTGDTLRGLINLIVKCGAELAGIAAIFLEGDTTAGSLESAYQCPVIYLDSLPVFPDIPEKQLPHKEAQNVA